MTTNFIFLLLALMVSLFVVYPIVQSRQRKTRGLGTLSNHTAQDLIERKETLYTAIKEIEFDYQVGKLSEDDFQQLRQQYKEEAVNLLKRIDQKQRKKSKPHKRKAGPQQVRGADKESVKYCWSCGTAISKHDKFCASCGSDLS
jgi:rRNA maturation endonuclease Nob1